MAAEPPGQGLARRFYWQVVSPLLAASPHAAALLGSGSEVLGYDDWVSTDHDFGARVQVFLSSEADPAPVQGALAGLPERFEGFPVQFSPAYPYHGQVGHQVEVTTVEDYFTEVFGLDPAERMGLTDWLLTPTQLLAGVTAGPVFHDPEGRLARRRAILAWYPDDIWRYRGVVAGLVVDLAGLTAAVVDPQQRHRPPRSDAECQTMQRRGD